MAERLNTEQLVALESAHLSGGMGRRPVTIVEGRGARLVDSDGGEYIDLGGGNGWGVLGHGHPGVTRAIREQAGRLVVYTEAGFNDQRALWFGELAAVLKRSLGRSERGPLSVIHPCNSGTEAVEAALKAARLFTGRPGVVAAVRGFHGRTLGALSATWKKAYREPFAPLVPGFEHVPFNRPEALAPALTDRTAALLLEVIQGEGGVHPATPEYLAEAARLCRERGVLLVVDEVQTGFGRTGRWFASEGAGIQPDMITLGKAVGGGIPMGAAVWRKDLGRLASGQHASTFGGNPLACAAGRAVLRALGEEDWIRRAAGLGEALRDRLGPERLPAVREVRGAGLMLGLELKIKVQPILRKLMDRRIWALPAGPNVLRLLPPLTIPEGDLEEALQGIEEVLRGE